MNDIPAFPAYITDDKEYSSGITIRDYFAGQALIGIIIETVMEPKFSAEQAYRYADAMLEARKGQ